MKFKYIWLFFPLLSILGCGNKESTNQTISLISSSKCKGTDLKAFADQSSDQDCIQYSWASDENLLIKHINAGFNCCPDGFQVDLKVAGDTLIITEIENASLCDCNCLFDLSYNLTGISQDNWWIRIVEPYIQQSDQEKILFKADLEKTPQGEFCITRTGFPWRL